MTSVWLFFTAGFSVFRFKGIFGGTFWTCGSETASDFESDVLIGRNSSTSGLSSEIEGWWLQIRTVVLIGRNSSTSGLSSETEGWWLQTSLSSETCLNMGSKVSVETDSTETHSDFESLSDEEDTSGPIVTLFIWCEIPDKLLRVFPVDQYPVIQSCSSFKRSLHCSSFKVK